jgi:transcriptional regulator with XRE-family HTH domain
MKNSSHGELGHQLDQRLPSLNAVRESAAVPFRGWLRAVREAKGLTQKSAAAKAGIKQQAFAQFETREVKGTITVESLAYAADALDCEVVYFLRPKSQGAKSFGGLGDGQDLVRTSRGTRAPSPAVPKDRTSDDFPVELR